MIEAVNVQQMVRGYWYELNRTALIPPALTGEAIQGLALTMAFEGPWSWLLQESSEYNKIRITFHK